MMPRLKRLAEKALAGDTDSMDDLIMEAPKGALDDMSEEEFAKAMVEDEDFAKDVYDRKSGPKYGSELEEDYSDDSRESADRTRMMSVVAKFQVPESVASDLIDAIVHEISPRD